MEECDESRSQCLTVGAHVTHYRLFAEVDETPSEYGPKYLEHWTTFPTYTSANLPEFDAWSWEDMAEHPAS